MKDAPHEPGRGGARGRVRLPHAHQEQLAQRVALAGLLLFCLTIPSNWTQDIPARYGKRHAGLQHSRLYPQIDTAAPTRPGAPVRP